MVARDVTLKKTLPVKRFQSAMYESQVSQGDTCILAEFLDTSALVQAKVFKQSDGSEITCTIAYNVVTITGVSTNLDVHIYAFGVVA